VVCAVAVAGSVAYSRGRRVIKLRVRPGRFPGCFRCSVTHPDALQSHMGSPEAALGRRAFLKLSGVAALSSCLEPLGATHGTVTPATHPTHVLRIRTGHVELAPGRHITTTTFDDRLPGPLLRGAVGQPLRIDIYNDTDRPERINWRGQGLLSQDSAPIAPRSLSRVEFTPARAGLYLYHSDLIAATRLESGLYSGLVGGLLVEPPRSQRPRGREYIAVLKDCEPFIHRTARGCEIGYRSLTVNGQLHVDGAPLDIGTRDPMLLHVLNASATEPYTLEIPGQTFEVVALDGYPVPQPATVTQLYVAPGERVTARAVLIGAWIIRSAGAHVWDYTRFGVEGRAGKPDATLNMMLSRHEAARSGLNRWCIDGNSYSADHPRAAYRLKYGLRYRLTLRNSSDEALPLHLQRHRLQIVGIDGRSTAGVPKDVICVAPHQQVEVDFTADSPGRALLQCTRQLHKDFGLMALLDYT
jgi:FtsP/CotA-like multicopper oxidase with cupredoxin domain